jgi:hypothetical protein
MSEKQESCRERRRFLRSGHVAGTGFMIARRPTPDARRPTPDARSPTPEARRLTPVWPWRRHASPAASGKQEGCRERHHFWCSGPSRQTSFMIARQPTADSRQPTGGFLPDRVAAPRYSGLCDSLLCRRNRKAAVRSCRRALCGWRSSELVNSWRRRVGQRRRSHFVNGGERLLQPRQDRTAAGRRPVFGDITASRRQEV